MRAADDFDVDDEADREPAYLGTSLPQPVPRSVDPAQVRDEDIPVDEDHSRTIRPRCTPR